MLWGWVWVVVEGGGRAAGGAPRRCWSLWDCRRAAALVTGMDGKVHEQEGEVTDGEAMTQNSVLGGVWGGIRQGTVTLSPNLTPTLLKATAAMKVSSGSALLTQRDDQTEAPQPTLAIGNPTYATLLISDSIPSRPLIPTPPVPTTQVSCPQLTSDIALTFHWRGRGRIRV